LRRYNYRKEVYEINSDEGEQRDEQILMDFLHCEKVRDYNTIENRITNGLMWGWLKKIKDE
jgi:hypothetical protein